ncbi:uncharacterized protein BP01DRAFT_341929 [Aspergillus saccharolyticus JOP 1030-1]|uniref:Rhodopsin domain-containing protein n=1 Tax=Aspergillus saccharolyticus JOP 1030-1 TaxID=1450539 RepID=A0A318ZJF2_9EURO|nr:hypothetical protein BP01DRAFT_341929 [Aspergillus saccharolyticus JOP 1030-1]PYH44683.1 hypothetical protein BP01DRAFT_341929 [Aspergillus saccharolyticus JOP 1030-1]
MVENRGPSLLIINGTFAAIATVFVVLRVISRGYILKKLGLDDAMIVFATVLTNLLVVLSGIGVMYGAGKHTWDLDPNDALAAAKLRFITHIVYVIASGCIKISICLLYLRLFPNLHLITLMTIAVISAMSTALFLTTIFQCSPVDAVYNAQKYEHYSCINTVAYWSAIGTLYLVTDIWVLVLPIPTIQGLQTTRRKKIVLTGVLSLGALACIASIVRMVYIVQLYTGSDRSWDNVSVAICSGVELALGIIAASIPSLKPMIHKWVQGFHIQKSEAST